jgi:hypothetical protein
VDKPLTIARTGPDDEASRAFVLTFRLFIQVETPWSNRQTDQINRLKAIKRQMYGRAGSLFCVRESYLIRPWLA